LFLAAGIIGLTRCWRPMSARKGWRWLPWLALIGILFAALRPVSVLAGWPLESRYSAEPLRQASAEAIVVLASTVYSDTQPIGEPILGFDTYGRCRYAARLYATCCRLPVVASGGGPNNTEPDAVPYALSMRYELQREGVPASAILVETRSRSTYENAAFTAAILRARGIRRIVLVTSAWHMWRAELCFRKQGLAVIPAPSDFRTRDSFHLTDLVPAAEPISWNEDALHEFVGLLWYRVHGWI
jgi:uncharacterized SAM-binding protein YcdF (DUF218 family)